MGTKEAKYDFIGEFHQGVAIVVKNGKYGAILQGGHEIIGPSYDYISPFKEGYADAIKNGIYFVLNLSGNMCVKDGSDYIEIPNKYQQARDFKDGLCCVCHDEKWGAIDKNGHEVIPTQYDYLSDFTKGIAIYRISSRDNIGHKYLFGFLNKSGAVFPAIYDSIWVDDTTGYIHTEYIERLIADDEKRIYNHPKRLDYNGRFVAKYDFEYITLKGKYDYVEDYVDEIAIAKKNDLWGAIDKNENVIIQFKYNILNRLDNDTLIGYLKIGEMEFDVKFIKTNGKLAGSNKNIRKIIPLDDGICLFCINKREGWNSKVKYGIVNKDGNVLLNAEYDEIQRINDILYKVANAKKEGLFDIQKGWILPCKFDSLSYINDYVNAHIKDLGDFHFDLSGNCFVLNQGITVELPKRCFVGRDFVDGYAPVCMSEKWGVVNSSFKTVVKPQYDNIQSLGNSVFKISHKNGLVDWEHGLYKIAEGELLAPKYKIVEQLSSSLFLFGEKSRFERKYDQYGVIDIKGKIVLCQEYYDIRYKDGFLLVKSDKELRPNLIVSSEGEIILDSLFDFDHFIGNNWVVTKGNHLYGCANLQTKKRHAPSFDEIEEFGNGMLFARKDGLVFYLNNEAKKVVKKGEKWEVIPDDIYWMGEFHDGIAKVLIDKNASDGVFIDETSRLVLFNREQQPITLPPQTTYAYPYDNETNCAIVKFGNAEGLINSNGDVICIPKYSEIERFNDSTTTYLCKNIDGKYGIVRLNEGEKATKEIIECKYSSITSIKENDDYTNEEYSELPELFQLEENGKIGIANTDGKIIIPCEYSKVLLDERAWLVLYKEKQNASSANEKRSIQQYGWYIHKDYMVGLADIKGNIITPPQYSSIQHLGGSLFSVSIGSVRKCKWGIMKTDGKMLTPLMFDDIDDFDGTCISVEYKGHQGYVNTDGMFAVKDDEGTFLPIKTTCDFVFDFNGRKAIALYKDYKGYVNLKGEILIKKSVSEYNDSLGEDEETSIYIVLPKQYEWGFDFVGDYAKVMKDGKFGLVYADIEERLSVPEFANRNDYIEKLGLNRNFKEIIPPKFDDIDIIQKDIDCYYSQYNLDFREKYLDKNRITLFVCSIGKLKYLYDSNGNIVCKSTQDTCKEKELKIVKKNNYFGVVSNQDISVIPCLYNSIYIEQESGTIITNFGCMNTSGEHIVYINDDNLLLSSKYRRIDEFINGVAIVDMVVDKKLKYGLVSTQGEEVLPPIYSFMKRLSNGMFKCCLNGRVGVVSKHGRYIIPNQYLSVGEYENGLSLVVSSLDGTYTKESLREYGYMDLDGNIVLSACSYISKQSDGICVICRYGKWGFYEMEKHTTTIVNNVSFLGLLHNDLAKANFGGTFTNNKVIGGKWGFVNSNGEIVINPEYDYVFNFSEGIAAVSLRGKLGFIDMTGTFIVPCEYSKVESHFKNGEGELVKGDKIYVFDRTGKIVSNRYVEKEYNDYDSWEDNTPSIYDNPYYNDNLDMDQQSIEFWNSL